MNKMITTNHKAIVTSISILLIIIWIIFSIIYIIKDKWEDFQLAQMQQGYQKGVSDSVSALMTESAKCNKIPLSYGDQIVEVVAVSCLTDSKEGNSQTSDGKKSTATEKPNE